MDTPAVFAMLQAQLDAEELKIMDTVGATYNVLREVVHQAEQMATIHRIDLETQARLFNAPA